MRKFSEIFADAKLKADLEGTLHGEDDTDLWKFICNTNTGTFVIQILKHMFIYTILI